MLSEETMRQSAPQQNEMLDPKNPFENPMENREYRMDYRRVLPQILLPGFQVPFAPEREERRAIRKCLNIAGLGILLSDLISQLLAFGLMFLVTWVLQMSYHMEWNTASDYLSNSSILIAINGLIFFTINTATACIGCKSMRIPLRSLFQTQDFTWKSALKYIPIGIGLQCVAAYLYTALSWFLEQGGLSGVDADFSYFSSGKSVLMTILYTCILAPLTEELLYRGFLMKTFSRVSIRFGILISALAFGLAHGNPAQFLLGFLVGIFMGKIDTRHNSLLPSILVHIAINSTSMAIELIGELVPSLWENYVNFGLNLIYLGVAFIGILFWFCFECRKPLPYNTQKQAMRNRVAWTAPCLLIALAFQIGMLLAFGLQ